MARIVMTTSYDPHYNLAMEEALLDHMAPTEPILMLWQNQHTVVIGQHQNAWAECNHVLLREEGGTLARRITGGGAVYHDLGNLNFSFLMPKAAYDLTAQLTVILDALARLGVTAEFSGRNDLVIAQRKFSGNAFCVRRNASLHHGTLLVHTDVEHMGRYLQVPKQKLESKGIPSVRARVVNLLEISPGLSVETIRDALFSRFAATYQISPRPKNAETIIKPEILAAYHRKQSSWEWQFGHSPKFNVTLEQRLSFGMLTLHLWVEDGIVQHAAVYSDAMDAEMIGRIAPALQGVRYDNTSLREALLPIHEDLAGITSQG